MPCVTKMKPHAFQKEIYVYYNSPRRFLVLGGFFPPRTLHITIEMMCARCHTIQCVCVRVFCKMLVVMPYSILRYRELGIHTCTTYTMFIYPNKDKLWLQTMHLVHGTKPGLSPRPGWAFHCEQVL